MKAWIESRDGQQREIVDRLHLGRGGSNDVALQGKEASRHHALICRDRAGCWLIDLDSLNGTWLNGSLLREPTLLRVGDIVRIGSSEFAFAQAEGVTRRGRVHFGANHDGTTIPTGEILYAASHAAAVVSADGQIVSKSTDFCCLISEFFNGPDQRLPEEVKTWFMGSRSRVWPLVTQRDGRRLQLRKTATDADQFLLFVTLEEPALSERALEPLGLSGRERDVLRWIAAGKRNEEIGMILGISSRTAEKHVQRLLEKLGAETRSGVVANVLQRLGVLERT